MRISVNIPSYKRPKVESLDYLPFCKVWVDEDEFNMYKNKNEGANIISIPSGIQGNVARVRNYILDEEFKKNDVVCIIDDDIKGFYRYDRGSKNGLICKVIGKENFIDFLEANSLLCKELGFRLWGMNLNKDPLSYTDYTPFSFSSVILGPFSCHLKNDIRYDVRIPLKEDYDLAIQHLNKYRGILRLNMCHYSAR